MSKFAGVYSEYFELLKSANGWLGRATRITGFASPPPLPVAPPAASPVASSWASPTSKAGGAPSWADDASLPKPPPPPPKSNAALNAILERGLEKRAPPPPPPSPPPPPPAATSQRQVKKALEEEEAKKKAEKAKKVKVSKKDRDEYATIEVEVERLEVAAVKAQAALDQANSAARRLSSREMLEIASAASAARRAADEKMERYMYLEELISQADA